MDGSKDREVVVDMIVEQILGEHYSDFLEWICGQKKGGNGYYRVDINRFLAGQRPNFPCISATSLKKQNKKQGS